MTADKQTIAYAKSLLKLCIVDGTFSEERVLAVLAALEKNPPRHYLAVLKAFHQVVAREVADRTADVEHAGALSPEAIESIARAISARYGRPIAVTTRPNESLIAGVRVRVGCDVFDASVAGALSELRSSLS